MVKTTVKYVFNRHERESALYRQVSLNTGSFLTHAFITERNQRYMYVYTNTIQTHMFQSDPASIYFYTGLENYAKFILALHSLRPAAYCLFNIYLLSTVRIFY